MATTPIPRISPAEYLKLEEDTGERFEYLNGEVFAMSGGTYPHNLISTNLIQRIGGLVREKGCKTMTSDQRIVVMETGLETYPDVSVICGKVQLAGVHGMAIANPVVLVEVLSKSTEAYDRGEKSAHYRRIESLREYLLIAQREVRVERYRRAGNNEWVLSEFTDVGGVLELASLGIEIPIAAIYDGVEFGAGGGQ